jgi:hypothetical protein
MSPDPAIQSELLSYLGQLPIGDQARVVDFARTLAKPEMKSSVGVPGKDLIKLAGTIGEDDAREMIEAIEEGCEQIDASKW